jgi:hypothetical protein
MPKQNMSEEEKKAWGEKMKAAREAKKQEPKVVEEVTISKSEFSDLLKTVAELKSQLAQPNHYQPLQQAQVTSQGLVGVQEKYSTTQKYPDPTERLKQEKRLAPFAFDYNYDLTFTINTSQYKTQEGIMVKEPKFEIKLLGVKLDEEGEQTNQRYIIRQLVFHEDPEAAITIAQEQGIQVDEENETDFLNEMRYLRCKAWLMDIFYPPKPKAADRRREEVIGNQVVEVFEVTSEKEVNAKGLL